MKFTVPILSLMLSAARSESGFCLFETEAFAGVKRGTSVSDFSEVASLVEKNSVKLRAIKTCFKLTQGGKEGQLLGHQLAVQSELGEQWLSGVGTTQESDSTIGCDTVTLPDGVYVKSWLF